MKLYKKPEAAEYLCIGISSLNVLMARELISYYKNPGSRGRVVFSEEHLDQYLKSIKVETMGEKSIGSRQ